MDIPDIPYIPSSSERQEVILHEISQSLSATKYVEAISQHVQEFEDELDAGEEIGIAFNFGEPKVIHVETIGAIPPSLIYFQGQDASETPVRLVQHVNQTDFMLQKVEVLDEEEGRTQIGFDLGGDSDDEPPSDQYT